MRCAVPCRHAVERRAAGAVDARQAEHARAERQPRRHRPRLRARGAAADRRALVDPGAAGIAIDAGRGEIAEPRAAAAAARRSAPSTGSPSPGRHRGQDMRRRARSPPSRASRVVETRACRRARPGRADDLPAPSQPRGDARSPYSPDRRSAGACVTSRAISAALIAARPEIIALVPARALRRHRRSRARSRS